MKYGPSRGQREDETVDWLFDATGWWLELLGGHQTFRSASVLLTPTPEHFPVDGTLTDEEMALEFFSCVAEHAGVRHWSFVLEPDAHPDARLLDVSGCWLGRGFIDLRAHLREPGEEHKETLATGRAAAAEGGFTAVREMTGTTPV